MNNVNSFYEQPNATSQPYGRQFDASASNLIDPVAAFDARQNHLDSNQYHHPSFQHRLGDPARNQSPALQHPSYHVNPVVPAKRGRPSEDGINASPHPRPGSISASRSQTPQQPVLGATYGAQVGQAFSAPTPYQHLQNTASSQATPSPTIQNQHFTPHPPPPQTTRPQTNSPHQFVNQHTHPGNNMLLQNNANRLQTLQNSAQQMYARGSPQMQGMPQPGMQGNMSGLPNVPTSVMNAGMDAQAQYQMRLQMAQQQQQQQLQGTNPSNLDRLQQQHQQLLQQQQRQQQQLQQQRQQQQPQPQQQQQQQQQPQQVQQQMQSLDMNVSGWPPRTNPQALQNTAQKPMPIQAPGQTPAPRLNEQQQHQRQQFLSSLQSFLQKNNAQTLPPDPRICGRPVDYFQIFMAIAKHGVVLPGPNRGNWPLLATAIGFPPESFPSAPGELKQLIDQYLSAYAATWFSSIQKRKQQQQQQQGQQQQSPQGSPQAGALRNPLLANIAQPFGQQNLGAAHGIPDGSPTIGHIGSDPGNFSPSVQQQSIQAHAMHQQSQPTQSQQQNLQQPVTQTFQNPIVQNQPSPAAKMAPLPRRTSANQVRQSTPVRTPQIKKAPSETPPRAPSEVREKVQTNGSAHLEEPKVEAGQPIQEHTDHKLFAQALKTYGGVDLRRMSELGVQVARLKANMPIYDHKGAIDVHSLIRSVQSGIHSLVSSALDQLIVLSRDRLQLTLDDCEDLMDALLDCGEEQLSILMEAAPDVSPSAHVKSYNHVQRECRLELETLQDTPRFASDDYELLHSADRILAITTILCNLSFFESNQDVLASANVVLFMAELVKSLGVRSSFLRTCRNTLEFMKDAVTYLSNTVDKIAFASRDDVACFLRFLVAFAPEAIPTDDGAGNSPRFAPYVPTLHHYLPCAVDSLAKLLARDDPNRAYCRAIFAAEATSSNPYELLSSTFGLAISMIPSRGNETLSDIALLAVSEARKPFFSQGMLAADILATLAPGSDSSLARSWLEYDDGWAANLLNLVVLLASQDNPPPPPPQRGPPGVHAMDFGEGAFELITHHGLSMLRKLGEKSELRDGEAAFQIATIAPLDEVLLRALLNLHFDKHALEQVMALTRTV